MGTYPEDGYLPPRVPIQRVGTRTGRLGVQVPRPCPSLGPSVSALPAPWDRALASVPVGRQVRSWASGPFTVNERGDVQYCLFYHGFDTAIYCYQDIQQHSMPGCTVGGRADRTPTRPTPLGGASDAPRAPCE